MSENTGVQKVNEHIMKPGRTIILTTFISNPSSLPLGTLYNDYKNGQVSYVALDEDGNKAWFKWDVNKLFGNKSIEGYTLKDDSISTDKIQDYAITTNKIELEAITSDQIKDKSITTEKLDDNIISSEKLIDNCISTNKIIDNAINSNKIQDKSITKEKLVDNIINEQLIADKSISTDKIQDKTITTSKIKDANITNELIADNAIDTNKIKNLNITTDKLDDSCVTYDKLANGSIKDEKIPDFAIKDKHIKAVDGSKIINNSIEHIKLSNNCIDTNNYIDGSISFDKFDTDIKNKFNKTLSIEDSKIIDQLTYENVVHCPSNFIIHNDNEECSLKITGNIEATGDITGARTFNPYFADIAEAYIPTQKLYPGDLVCLSKKGNLKIEKFDGTNGDRFLGVVSNKYATLLGATKEDIEAERMIPVCLIGRLRVNIGKGFDNCYVGNYLSLINTDHNNYEIVISKTKDNNTFGRLLEDKNINSNFVLCQLWQ